VALDSGGNLTTTLCTRASKSLVYGPGLFPDGTVSMLTKFIQERRKDHEEVN